MLDALKAKRTWMAAFAAMTAIRFELGASDSARRGESQEGSEYFTGGTAVVRPRQ
jgi:hypothetical protein